jgi:hypothetical protein
LPASALSLVIGALRTDTLPVRRAWSLAAVPLALIAGGCGGRANSAHDAASPEGGSAADARHEPLPDSPNVIIVLTDDQGYADVGVFGAQGLATPNLDRLAGRTAPSDWIPGR